MVLQSQSSAHLCSCCINTILCTHICPQIANSRNLLGYFERKCIDVNFVYIISGLHEYFICLEAPELCVTQPGCMQLLIVVQKIKGFHGNPANLQIKFNYRIGGNFCEGFNLVNWQIPNAIAKFTIRQNYCTESEYASRERVMYQVITCVRAKIYFATIQDL